MQRVSCCCRSDEVCDLTLFSQTGWQILGEAMGAAAKGMMEKKFELSHTRSWARKLIAK